jgi:hypothetical protein
MKGPARAPFRPLCPARIDPTEANDQMFFLAMDAPGARPGFRGLCGPVAQPDRAAVS